jgi:hypothetical protein
MKPGKKLIKLLSLLSFILGVLSLLWLIYDYVLYNKIMPVTLAAGDLGRLENFGLFVWISYLYMFVFHILAGGTLILQSRYFRKMRTIQIITLMAGVISFICLFGDWALLGDIGKEYKMGWDVSGEWTILYIFLRIHIVFMLLMTALSASVLFRKKILTGGKELEQKDEMVFSIAHYVGILCGLLGVAYTIMSLIITTKMNIDMKPEFALYHMMSTTIMILIPYGMVVIYWLTLKLKEKIGDWYDEKQLRDISIAGLMTLLISIPVLGLFFFIVSVRHLSYSADLLWFPFTLFVILFLFSLITLINYRRT